MSGTAPAGAGGPPRRAASDDGAQLVGLALGIVLLMVLLTVTALPLGRGADLRAEAVSAADAAALAAAADLSRQWRELLLEAQRAAEREAEEEREEREQAREEAVEAGEDPSQLPDPADVRVVVAPVDLGRLDGRRAEVEAAAWADRNGASLVGFAHDVLEVEVATASKARLSEGVASPLAGQAVSRARAFLADPPVLLPVDLLEGEDGCAPPPDPPDGEAPPPGEEPPAEDPCPPDEAPPTASPDQPPARDGAP